MRDQTFKAAFKTVEIVEVIGPQVLFINDIAFDSRLVKPGGVFVALRGKYHDGHRYINAACKQGAAIMVGEQPHRPPHGKTYVHVGSSRQALSRLSSTFYRHPTQRLMTVGVTGTKGKTSVSHLCAHLLENASCISTVTNIKRHLLNTTPESLDIHRLAHEALMEGKRHFVLEVSSHALHHHRVDDVAFNINVFTNLSQDHFDDFDGFEPYFEAKAKLFTNHPNAQAVVNVDDVYGKKLIERLHQNVITFGLSSDALIRATHVNLKRDQSSFDIETPTGQIHLSTLLPGQFNVYNLLAAASVGYWTGMPLAQIKHRLESVTRIEGRFERLQTSSGVHVVVDFAHSPDSLEQSIHFLKSHYPKLITVFGCGGESDPYKRPIMGEISGRSSDYTILTHDNPKKEDPMLILNQTEAGLRQVTQQYEVIPERPEAIERALSLAKPGDCVLVAGKGHETFQEFGQHMVDFNDVAFLIKACGAMPREIKR